MKTPNYVMLYLDSLEVVNQLDDIQIAKLFRCIIEYANSGVLPTIDDKVVSIAFLPIKQYMERQISNYENKVKMGSVYGKTGGRPSNKKGKKGNPSFEKGKKGITNTNTNTNTNTSTSTSTSTKTKDNISAKADNVSFERFIEAFNLKRKGNFRPIESVKKKYEARLKEGYTSKQLMIALITAMKDDFHKENNFKYLTPEFICRSDKLERYLNLTEKQ